MDVLFELLFKYRPLVFEQGELAFLAPGSVRLGLLAAGVAGALAVASYTMARGRSVLVDRVVMASLRVILLGLLLLVLLHPALVVSSVVPQQNFVGVLIDDSRSMQLVDAEGQARSAFVADAFTPGESPLLQSLADRFTLRFFRFDSRTTRVDGLQDLTYTGTHTDIGTALEAAQGELAGIPLSGLVLVSDGADNGVRPLTESLLPLQAAGVPVFTVGLGEETLSPDIEMGRVELPRAVLEGSTLLVDVVVTQVGFGRATVPLVVEDNSRVLAEEEVELGPEGEPVVASVRLELQQPGPQRIRFRIPVQEGERVDRNNAREVNVEVRAEREKVLYLEGEPRSNVKFMTRAVEDDENLQLVVLLRTAEGKFYRMGVDGPDELEAGFPRTREELYGYRALVLGSVEASFFSHDQLQMIADFVSERGGGLLALGGRRAFAEGGWAGTAVEEVLPVILAPPEGDPEGILAEVKVAPTPAGAAHAAIQLGREGESSRERWAVLPPVTVVNPISEVPPGATALLVGSSDDLAGQQIVLAHQRYGRGKALALTVQDDWLWQMLPPVEDQSHETFWQQLLRWLVDDVPERVVANLETERAETSEPVRLITAVVDSTHIEVNDADVLARVTDPLGGVSEVPAEWTVERDGEYAIEIVPEHEGEYEIEVVASRQGAPLGSDVTYLHVGPSEEEYFGAGRRTSLLRRIAEETGGQFYTPETVGSLADDITVTGAGVTLVEERDLWDMPALFLAMFLIMGTEWGYRRMRGLA